MPESIRSIIIVIVAMSRLVLNKPVQVYINTPNRSLPRLYKNWTIIIMHYVVIPKVATFFDILVIFRTLALFGAMKVTAD